MNIPTTELLLRGNGIQTAGDVHSRGHCPTTPADPGPDKMRKIKPQPAALNPNPRWHQYRRRALLFVLIAAALAMGVAGWHFREPRPDRGTLSEVLAAGKYDGFDVVQAPDRPGPYKDIGATSARPGEPLSGSFWANGKTRRFHLPGVPGEEFRVVGLIPQDGGEPTYVVLKRRAAPASPVGQTTK
jgi:hypothetical protein